MLSRLINQASHKGLRIKVGRPTLSVFSTTPEGRGVDPLKTDERTQKSQEEANATDDATKDSIKHAAEGNMKEALKTLGRWPRMLRLEQLKVPN